MKNLILAVITVLCTLSGNAQNGGQYNQNNAVRLQFMGLINGDYYMKVTNRLFVPSNFRYDYNGNDVTFPLGALKDTLINMHKSIQGVVKVKNLNPLPFIDNGWVELCLSVTPLQFVSSSGRFIPEKDEVKIDFVIAEVSNISRIMVEVSIDGGRTYYNLGLVWPAPLKANKSYSISIPAERIREMHKKQVLTENK